MEDLKQLNIKFDQLVETRRELYNQNQELKQRNKAVLDKVKQKNEKLKQELNSKQDQLENPSDISDVQTLEKELAVWRRKLDDQKAKTEKKKQKLQVLQDKHSEVVKALSGPEQPGATDEPQLKQMRVLENRLDKLMIKNNEAQSIKQTYTVILKRFKEEKLEYEGQLKVIEKALNGKSHDLQDLIQMSKEAKIAQTQAERDLENFKPSPTTKQKNVAASLDVVDVSRKQQKNSQDNSNQDDQDLKPALKVIKEATGLTDLKEIQQKMERHSSTITQLTEMQKSLQVKLMNLFTKRDNLMKQINGRESDHQAEDYDQLEREVSQTQTKCDALKHRVNEERKMLAQVSSGIQMLTTRLGVVQSGNTLADIEKCKQRMSEIKQSLSKNQSSNRSSSMKQSPAVSQASSNIRVKVADKHKQVEQSSDEDDDFALSYGRGSRGSRR